MRSTGSDEGTWVLFLHGNAATIASQVNIAHYSELRNLGVNVLAPEYHGFAGLGGAPTEALLASDARAAYDYLRTVRRAAPSRIVIYGWSLGSRGGGGARIQKLKKRPSSSKGLRHRSCRHQPAALPVVSHSAADAQSVRVIQKITRVEAPILFLHSPEDAVIPIAEGRRLYEAARGEKTFVEVRGGHVDATTADTQRFYGAIRIF